LVMTGPEGVFENVRTDLGFLPFPISILSQMVTASVLMFVYMFRQLIRLLYWPRSVPLGLRNKVHLDWIEAGSEEEARVLAERASAISPSSLEPTPDPERHAALMLLLCYADLSTDLVLVSTLLGSSQATYGVISLCILGVSLLAQVVSVRYLDRVAWLSKDVLLTALGLGPLLHAYRVAYGEPPRADKLYNANQMLGALKAIKVVLETLPKLVLQMSLLTSSVDSWSVPLLVSTLVSIVAASVLIVDAEKDVNGGPAVRRRNLDYYGYLPMAGRRRYWMLFVMTFFSGAYLVMAACTVAVALRLFPPWTVAMVLAADCGLHQLMRAAAGEWWNIGDASRSVALCFVDALANVVFWLFAHGCLIPSLRVPDWTGPHHTARIVVCSILEGAFVICAALLLPEQGATRVMAQWVCLPALVVVLVTLALFFALMEPCYRRTFWAPDSRHSWHRRHMNAWMEQPHGEGDIARLVAKGGFLRYVGEPVVVWIEQHAAAWKQEPPAWCTVEWRAALTRRAHLLPGDGAARVATILGGSEGAKPAEVTHIHMQATPSVDCALVV